MQVPVEQAGVMRIKSRKVTQYRKTAQRYGYQKVAPFVRRLLDAARRGDPQSGNINFFTGSDDVGSPKAA